VRVLKRSVTRVDANSKPVPALTEYGQTQIEAQMRDAITGIGLVAFGTIAVVALCIGVCALADGVLRVVA
jgi:hypothetical protein